MHQLSRLISEADAQQSDFGRYFAGCLIKTHDGRLLLQKRGKNWDRFPDTLATFGGQIDAGESSVEGMARELAEELGAQFTLENAVYLGGITKAGLDNALIYTFWWHDKGNSITGCYEGDPAYFASAAEILSQHNITPDVYWIVTECLSRGLLAT